MRTLLALVLVSLTACVVHEESEPLPSGPFLSGEASAARRVLERIGTPSGTPLASSARALLERISECEALVEIGSSVEGPGEPARCLPRAAESGPVRRLRGESQLAFGLPLGAELSIVGTARVDAAGRVEVDARAPRRVPPTAIRLLVPGPEAPGAPILSGRDVLLHARVRPSGLDIASWVPEGSQADRLFRLKSALFTGVVLEGTWEVAVYVPDADRALPPAALALDARITDGAVAAMESFIRELSSAWPVHRVPFAVDDRKGACLPDLRVLPDLAPCYVATEGALVVGWNARAVRRALSSGDGALTGSASALFVDLERMAETDRRLQAAATPGLAPLNPGYGWRALRAEAGVEGDGLRVRMVLEPVEES